MIVNSNAQAPNDPILNDLCDFLIQPSSVSNLAFVGDFHENFEGGLEVGILKPTGFGSPLQQGFQNCAPGELAFIVLDDECTGQIDFTVTIDVPSHQFGLPQAFQNPTFTARGDLIQLQPSTTVNGVTTLTLRLNATTNLRTRCGAIVLTYPVAPSITSDLTYIGASLFVDRFNSGCVDFDESEWGGLPDAIALQVTIPSILYSDNQLIRANDFGTVNAPSQSLVLITGNPIYADNFWPASQPGGVRFAMAPGATISFGDANNVVAGLTVPNGRFFPCSTQPYNTVEIGPNSSVTFVDPGLSSSTQPTIFGATTGVTVQANALFAMNAGEIRSCNTGVTGERARSVTLTNININQDAGSYPGSNFISQGTRGVEGINLRTTDGASPIAGQYTFSNVTIDNFRTGVSSGNRSSYRGPFILTLQNSTISNSQDGVLLLRGLGGRYNVRGNNINVTDLGIEFIRSRNSVLAGNSNTIVAGLGGIEVNNPGSNFIGATSNIITNPTDFGVRIRSRGDLYGLNSNSIGMAANSTFQAYGIGVFSNSRGAGNALNNIITTGANINNFGMIFQGALSFLAGGNSVQLSESQSTGIVIADSRFVTTNCNQVTITGVGTRGATTGIELATNTSSNHGCNFLNQTVNGLQILGGNTGASYTSNTFVGNDVGLLVGGLSNVSGNQSNVLIGGQQMNADNVWADVAQSAREARHLTSQTLRDFNRFEVRPTATYFPANGTNGPVVFQNIPSLDQWFRYSIPSGIPAGCPAVCSVLPPIWPIDQPCLPDAVASQDSDYPSFQRQQARLNAKYASDFDQTPCDDNVLPCYQEIANLEQEFYDIFGSSMSEETYESYRTLLAAEQEQNEDGYSDEFLDNVMSLFDMDSPSDLDITADLTILLNKLYTYDPCEEVTELWQESLVLAVQQEMPDGLTESQQVEFKAIANKCAGFDGPGVHIARASLGLAVSDGQTCGSMQDSKQLVLRTDKGEKSDQVFPNPVKIGGVLSFEQPITGWVEIFDGLGHKMDAKYLEKSSTYSLPNSIGSGLYFIRTADGAFSSSFVISE